MNMFENCDKNLMNTLSIKSEMNIKEEPLEFQEENCIKFESVNLQNEGSEIFTDLHYEKPWGSNFVKIEVKHEDAFDKACFSIIEDNDHDMKADIDVKIEDNIKYGSHNSNNDVIRKRNIINTKKDITNEANEVVEIFDYPSPSSSRLGNGKRNNMELKNEERKKEGNKIKDFEFGKRIKLDAKFECSSCDYKTDLKGSLKSHLLVHSTVKLFKCSKCDFECNYKRNLKLHLLSHSNTKLFKCSECDYECNQKSHLKIHLLSHSNTKIFKCSECDYDCNRKAHLQIHLLSHSNTKLFKCSECDYECNYKGNLKNHLLIIHSNTKLFKCSECDYECNYKNHLKVHLLTHSKNENTINLHPQKST